MEETKKDNHLTRWLSGFLFVALAAGGYLGHLAYKQKNEITLLLTERNYFLLENASTTKALAETNDLANELAGRLSLTEEELAEVKDDLRDERRKNDNFEDKIDKLTGTVGTLDKLSKLDEELLQKYSKVYFLSENYYPDNLREIKSKYILTGKKDQYFVRDAMPFLEALLEAADDDDIDLKILSAYRSFDEQIDVKGQFTQVYGEGANTFSADQGYSEHQLGTTLDFASQNITTADPTFAETEAYKWLLENAYKYGFVLSYPENNNFYIFEPWHWRFVGEDLARDLRRDDRHFYDLTQRELDEYLISIFD